MANVPENIDKKMKATWEERITGFLSSYVKYTQIVCGDLPTTNHNDCWEAHEKKWNIFESKLTRSGVGIHNYSVHY